jgi:WD40 repeat protein
MFDSSTTAPPRSSSDRTPTTTPRSLSFSQPDLSSASLETFNALATSHVLWGGSRGPGSRTQLTRRVVRKFVGGALNALSLSPDRKLCVVAGREVLKILQIEREVYGHSVYVLDEVQNLRVGKLNLSYSSNDVKWHPLPEYKHLIASAATNGAVVIWNVLQKGGKKLERKITEHTRTVNKVCWSPQHAHLLLSASQDGTMRLWDLREAKNVACTNFVAKVEVRDIAFSPMYPNYFAAGLENGALQIWDLRRSATWSHSLQAHQGLILSLDWHPTNPNLLATGGRDRMVKTWDLTLLNTPAAERPVHRIQAFTGVGRVRWRGTRASGVSVASASSMATPSTPSSGGVAHSLILATCASLMDTRITVWHMMQPYIPLFTLGRHSDVVTGVEWLRHDTATLSCSKDGTVQIVLLDKDWHVLSLEQSSTLLEDGHEKTRAPENRDTKMEKDKDTADSEDNNDKETEGDRDNENDSEAQDTAENVATPRTNTFLSSASYSGDKPSKCDEHELWRTLETNVLSDSELANDVYCPLERISTTAVAWTVHNQLAVVFDAVRRSVDFTPTHSTSGSSQQTPRGTVRVFMLPSPQESAPTDRPKSSTLSLGPDPHVVQYLAQNYRLRGNIADVCWHNAQVARSVHREQLAQMWLLLRVMYAFDYVSTQRLPTVDVMPVQPIALSGDSDNVAATLLKSTPPSDGKDTPSQLLSSAPAVTSDVSHARPNKPTRASLSPTHPPISLTPTLFVPSPSHQLFTFSPSSSPPPEELPLPALAPGMDMSHSLSVPQSLPHRMPPIDTIPQSDISGTQSASDTSDVLKQRSTHSPPSAQQHHHHSYRTHDYMPLTVDMWQDVVLAALQHYAQQGDVQTCATVLLVLNQRVDDDLSKDHHPEHHFLLQPQRKVALQWFMAYIELLARLELWNCANEVIKYCYLDAVHNANQKSTTIATACAKCGKPIQSGWLCDRPTCGGRAANNSGLSLPQPPPAVPQAVPSPIPAADLYSSTRHVMNVCSVCHQHVRGLWAWCQGCGHGGHLHHLKAWFATERACPTGCSHYCVYSF